MNLCRYVRRLWTLLFSFHVFGDIIRKDIYFEGKFSNIHQGRMLSVLMVFNYLPLDKCTAKCIQHIRCKSVNYNFAKEKCELTDVDFNDDEADELSFDWYNYGTHEKVDGKWGSWMNVTQCTATCGVGTLIQARDFDSPEPAHGGDYCVGSGERTIDCNTHPCPVNGAWGEWKNITKCTATCNGGTLDQTRECDSPRPEHGGDDCNGDKTRTVPCNTHVCPVFNIALNKQARHSGHGGFLASRGNDGNKNTFSLTMTKPNTYWQVDLGADTKIEYIIFRANYDSLKEGGYKNIVVKGKSTTGSIFEICNNLGDLTEVDVKFSCTSSNEYRYIKMEKLSYGKLCVKEFEVYAKQN